MKSVGASAKRYFVGLVFVIEGSRWGETAVRGTERNGIVWDWYCLLLAACG